MKKDDRASLRFEPRLILFLPGHHHQLTFNSRSQTAHVLASSSAISTYLSHVAPPDSCFRNWRPSAGENRCSPSWLLAMWGLVNVPSFYIAVAADARGLLRQVLSCDAVGSRCVLGEVPARHRGYIHAATQGAHASSRVAVARARGMTFIHFLWAYFAITNTVFCR
jgi:hypothetical protein